MTIPIKIRYTCQAPGRQKSRAERAADEDVIIQIPDRRLTRAEVLKHPVRVTIAVKVAYLSPASKRRWRGRRGWCGRIYQVVTDDIEVDPFRRCRGDIG